MKYTIILALLLLSACAYVPTAKPAATLSAPQGTPELAVRATQEPEQTATATIGYEATAQAAQATADGARLIVAEYTAEHERNLEAMALRTQEAFTFQQTALPLRATQDAETRATDAALQVMHATGTADGQAFAARVPTIQAAMTQVQYTAGREFTAISLTWVTMLVALVLAVVALYWLYSRIMADPAPEPETPNELDARPARMQHYAQTPGPYPGEMLVDGIPATRSQLQHIAALVIGQSVDPSHGNCTPSGICFSRGGFVAFCKFVVDQEYADEIIDQHGQLRGVHFNASGRAFLKPYFDNPCETSPTPQGFMSTN